MEFTKTENGFVKYDENGKVIAEITYSPTDNPDIVVADHTFVDSSLRGRSWKAFKHSCWRYETTKQEN